MENIFSAFVINTVFDLSLKSFHAMNIILLVIVKCLTNECLKSGYYLVYKYIRTLITTIS